jgi:NADH:ubiquinone oxidoreductase subunit K
MSRQTRMILYVAAACEAATGAALLVVPSLVGRLLLGEELTGVAVPVARVTGIALIALGVACWPGGTALCGMLVYSAAVTLYLAYVGFTVGFAGILLWPVVVVHLILTALLTRASISGTETIT